MAIKHHLTDDLLMAYAAGTLSEAFSLAVATHISLCDDCRATLAAYEAMGGAILDRGDDLAPMSNDALARAMARLDIPAPASAQKMPKHPVLPAPLQHYVGTDLSAIKWRKLGMGVRQAILPTNGKGGSARLLYIPAGHAVPAHGHRGMELTLVLKGAFRDEAQQFSRGDIEIATEADEHTPVAMGDEDCICLAVTDAPLRFNALIPRLMQPIFQI
jgi:putative transcriptional regulator